MDKFTHPTTGHEACAYADEWDKPDAITIDITPSRYLTDGTPCEPGEAGDYMAEMSGVIMTDNPDGSKNAKIWVQMADGKSIPKAALEAAALLQTLWNECMHGDDPGVPHCYCTPHTFEEPGALAEGVKGYECCRCKSAAPMEYFDGTWGDATQARTDAPAPVDASQPSTESAGQPQGEQAQDAGPAPEEGEGEDVARWLLVDPDDEEPDDVYDEGAS